MTNSGPFGLNPRLFVFIATSVVLVLLAAVFSYNKSGSSLNQTSNEYKASVYKPSELQALLENDKDKYAIIDVRTKQEFDKGHLPGAVHADYYDTEALKKAAGDKIPITYCAFSAMRGPYAAYQLHQAGFTNVASLVGGISAWAEDVDGNLESANPNIKNVFNHPKDIFPKREASEYPKGQGEVTFNITATKFSFSPNQIVVKHGQKVTLNLKSLDVVHGFALPEFRIEKELLPNKGVTVTFIADRKGNFPFVCSVICGHNHSSMVGNLIVK